MDDRFLSERVAKQVLTRAIELDQAKGTQFSVTELRSIAAEVGVSRDAFDRALSEAEIKSLAPIVSARRSVIVALASGTTIGATIGLIDVTTYFTSSPLGMGATLLAAGALSIANRMGTGFRELMRTQAVNAMLWGSYAAIWALTSASAGGAGSVNTMVMIRTTVVGWAMASVFGLATHALRSRHRHSSPSGELRSTSTVKQRIAAKLKAWIDMWANRVTTSASDKIRLQT